MTIAFVSVPKSYREEIHRRDTQTRQQMPSLSQASVPRPSGRPRQLSGCKLVAHLRVHFCGGDHV